MSIHELLPWYTNETLGPEEAAAFEKHLSGCETCTRELELLRKVEARLESQGEALLSDHPTPPQLIAALAPDADDADLDPGVAVDVRRHVALCPSCADDAGWAIREATGEDPFALDPAAPGRARRSVPTWGWSLAAAVLLVALAVPLAMRIGASRSMGPGRFHVVEPVERSGSEPTVVAVPAGSDRVHLTFPLDVGPEVFPLLLEIADRGGESVHRDDSIRPEDLSEQGLFLFRVVPRSQLPDGSYVARIGPASSGEATDYPFRVIAAPAP